MYINGMAWLFGFTIFLSSSLLFLLEPMCAKMLLPTLGGAPSVWNTCMMFFQAGLLLGYGYVHFGIRFLGAKRHALVQLLFMIFAFWLFTIPMDSIDSPPVSPLLWLMRILLNTIGLPFFVVASCAPLLQRWYVQASGGEDPYFLYAVSNLGSFAALVLYPFLLEPNLSLNQQADLWFWGYAALLLMCLTCSLTLAKSQITIGEPRAVRPRSSSKSLRWVLLALAPSSLMLSVTTYLTSDIAAIPLLWVIPLGLYLLTFTLVFARRQIIPHGAMIRWMPMVVVVLALVILLEATEPMILILSLHLLGFFWLALVCHGELARTRPPSDRLTEFYLWITLGGVLGGVFNVLIAPLVFKNMGEYPMMLALACLLRPGETAALTPRRSPYALLSNLGPPMLVGGLTLGLIFLARGVGLPAGPLTVGLGFVPPLLFVYFLQNRPLQFGLSFGMIFLASCFYPGVDGPPLYSERTFFGIHRVTEQAGYRKLFHGNTLHGEQSLDPERRREPLTYYYRTGPIGQVLTSLKGDPRLRRVGLIGLGTGALAAYAGPGDDWTFFEIDPAVAHIAAPATGLFTYLKDCQGQTDVVLGDARLTLQRHPDKFGVLVVDAFGSDAIPLHLLTREALQIYLAHLETNGILMFHISNRYVNLEPVLANLAQDAQPPLLCTIQKDLVVGVEAQRGKAPSVWVLLARKEKDLGPLAKDGRWRLARPRPDLEVWTDDFSNLASVLDFGDR
jgi:hypothetical protein